MWPGLERPKPDPAEIANFGSREAHIMSHKARSQRGDPWRLRLNQLTAREFCANRIAASMTAEPSTKFSTKDLCVTSGLPWTVSRTSFPRCTLASPTRAYNVGMTYG